MLGVGGSVLFTLLFVNVEAAVASAGRAGKPPPPLRGREAEEDLDHAAHMRKSPELNNCMSLLLGQRHFGPTGGLARPWSPGFPHAAACVGWFFFRRVLLRVRFVVNFT